ncbi:MAG: hypothetical protein V3V49_03495 [Candidatus Krumholzibacteria bacterium]
MKKVLITVAVVCLAAVGCSKLKSVAKVYDKMVSKDISLEDQKMLTEKYQGRKAWTRTMLEDLTEREIPGEAKKQIVLRDSKIEIVDINFAYNGAVTVMDRKRKKIVHALKIETPLTVEKIEDRLGELMWFKSPMLRQVDYIRAWGKRAARAVINHEIFIGMPVDAALESWGIPTEIRSNDIGSEGDTEEQWAYRQSKRPKYIYVRLPKGIVTKWEE